MEREIQIDEKTVVLRQAALDDVVDLRHRVLRAGLPRESAIFPGDELESALHFAAFYLDRSVGCATFHLNHWQDEPAWQLRGMATDESFRGKGVGRELLELAEAFLLRAKPVRILWANARVPALKFYQSLGWHIASPEFDIPTAGPHCRITKTL